MKRKILALALALTLCLGLVPAGLAYTTPDFKDVPANNWAYKYVMEMADAGIIKGTGDRQFSPESKVSAAMLLTLVGRVTFPDLQDGAGADWAKPYVEAAQNAGWLEGTNIDPANTAAEVTRYDMAVILAKASKKLGISEKSVDTSKIKDYGEIPNKYSAAVIQVYGNGLINGDGNGNFSGASTMRRNEAAAVMSRLIALKPGGSTATNPGNTSTEPTKDEDWEYAVMRKYVPNPYDPDEVEVKEGERITIYRDFMAPDAWGDRGKVYLHVGDTLQLTVSWLPSGYNYTKADVKWSSSNESVAVVDENGLVTAVGKGVAWIEAEVPVIYYKNEWTRSMDRITVYCEP